MGGVGTDPSGLSSVAMVDTALWLHVGVVNPLRERGKPSPALRDRKPSWVHFPTSLDLCHAEVLGSAKCSLAFIFLRGLYAP